MKLKNDQITFYDFNNDELENIKKSLEKGNIHSMLCIILHNQAVICNKIKEIEHNVDNILINKNNYEI